MLQLRCPPPVECADPPPLGCYWSWAQYVQSLPTLCKSFDWAHPLTVVVRGDGYRCASGSWSQLAIGLLNHGVKAKTPALLWVVGMAVAGDEDMTALGRIWAQVLQVCSLKCRVHTLFIIWTFLKSKIPFIKRRAAGL